MTGHFLAPNFSALKLMKDVSLLLGFGDQLFSLMQETENMTTANNLLEVSLVKNAFDSRDRPLDSANEFINAQVDAGLVLLQIQQLSPPCNGVDDRSLPEEDASGNNHCKVAENGQSVLEEMNSQSPEVVESLQVSHDNTSSLNEGIDITKGQEKIAISVVNEVNSEHPPSFQYIPQNTVFQNAYVNISLARIGDDHSCSTCSGDCLSLSVPCACAYETGGEFAYTEEGLVKEEFLKECISMNRDPGKHCQFYCTECPLERSKNDNVIEPCKGHLVRNFIKECWRKCGCNIQCGNRVVQRGISRKLQVRIFR